MWAGNNSAPPSAGNGTCGSQSYGSSLTGAGYHTTTTYTHLGQLWKGSLDGNGPYQYLYCSSSNPHQLSGLYAPGSTCSNKSGEAYKSSYDAWGNVTSRTYQGNSTTLSYDSLDHLTKWGAGSGTNEFYVYDSGGNRVLRRSSTSGTTTLTVYAFGLEEHLYSSNGTNQGNTSYYSLGGRLIGELTGPPASTSFFMTDGLGSVLATFSNTNNNAAILGNQVYAPYGTSRYAKGTMGTNKGFTGGILTFTKLGTYLFVSASHHLLTYMILTFGEKSCGERPFVELYP